MARPDPFRKTVEDWLGGGGGGGPGGGGGGGGGGAPPGEMPGFPGERGSVPEPPQPREPEPITPEPPTVPIPIPEPISPIDVPPVETPLTPINPTISQIGAAFLPFTTGTSGGTFTSLLSKQRNSEFKKLLQRHVKTEFEKLLEGPVKSKVIREGAKATSKQGLRMLLRRAPYVGAAVLGGELFAGFLDVLGRAKQEIADERRRDIDTATRERLAAKSRPPPFGNDGRDTGFLRLPSPDEPRGTKRLPRVRGPLGGATETRYQIPDRTPEWGLYPTDIGVDPTTVSVKTPTRGVGTSPAPLGMPSPAPKKAPTASGFSFDFRMVRPNVRPVVDRLLFPLDLTPFNDRPVRSQTLPLQPLLPGDSPRTGSGNRTQVTAPFLGTPFAPVSAGGSECFVPKKGGRRGQCRQGYFRETASGVFLTTWSRRKCPP